MHLSKEELSKLVKKAEKDPLYFEELYEIFFPKIYNYFYFKVNDKSLAEDMVSDVFIKILNNISKCRDRRQFQSWAFAIARNYLIDFYRKKSTNIEASSSSYEDNKYYDNNNSFNPEDALMDKISREELSEVLKILSKSQQDVIILRFFEELKLKEIAEIMNKSEGAVKGLLYRGIKALTSELSKRGVIS